jgi:hypothetical protein
MIVTSDIKCTPIMTSCNIVLSEKSGQDDSNSSDSDEATTEVISHTEGLEALERALLYVEQHSKATPSDVIFMKR